MKRIQIVKNMRPTFFIGWPVFYNIFVLFLVIFENLYATNKVSIMVKIGRTDWIKIYQDVPQGTILGGPLLFNNYVNRMKETITENCEVIQDADDT